MRWKKKACSFAEHLRSDSRIRGRDLLFCFSSRPSAAASSSASAAAAIMRAPSSKSILSPGRSRDPSAGQSLSSSLSRSRRLRSSGSVKGGQSPMFPSVGGGRRKGIAFEAAEPSSPKVTCIGQVRVKSKKRKAAAAAKGKGVALRSRSMRGEASFRRTDGIGGMRECLPSRNQRWAYQLPVSICEALRTIGSEFNCLFPCGGRSMCSPSRSGEGKEGEKRSNSCVAVLARWLMAVPDSIDGKRREMVNVVVDDRKQRKVAMLVKETVDEEELELELELEKSEEVVMASEEEEDKEEEEARVSICIPPKNALLLMRCRSDPVRMAALASRFWESPAMQVRVEEGDGEEEEDGVYGKLEGEKRDFGIVKEEQNFNEDEGIEVSDQAAILITKETKEETMPQLNPDELKPSKDENLLRSQDGQEASADEERADLEMMDTKAPLEDKKVEEKEGDRGKRSGSYSSRSTMEKEERKSNRHSSRSKEAGRTRSSGLRERDRRRHSFSTVREVGRSSFGNCKEARRASFSVEAKGKWSFCIEKDDLRLEKAEVEQDNTIKEETANKVEARNSPCIEKEDLEEVLDQDREERPVELEAGEKKEPERKSERLPDCLLLMMYEPKLSMEVSKETWVCSNDFLQWRLYHPNYQPRHPSKASAAVAMTATSAGSNNDKDEVENEEAVTSIPVIPHPPPQPARPPTAPEAEEKSRGKAGAALTPVPPSLYGPLVLTRCKSEPMRSSAKLTPDACFWKDRHRPIGAAGIGF